MKAVIFDMDGVLIDSEPEYLNFSFNFAKSKNPNVTLADLYGMLGSSGKDAWSTMERAVNNGQSWEDLRLEFRSTIDVYSFMDYRKIFRKESIPVLDYIKEQGLPIALASSTQMDIIERVLDENGIRHYFSQSSCYLLFYMMFLSIFPSINKLVFTLIPYHLQLF